MTQSAEACKDSESARPGLRVRMIALGLVLLVASAVRIPWMGRPADDFLAWRETQTLMMARNFARDGMNLFRPSVDWRSTSQWTTYGTVGGSELPLVPWLTGALYLATGTDSMLAGRVFPVLFSVAGVALFFTLLCRWMSLAGVTVASLLLAVSPYYLYCGVTQMPESLAYALSFASLLTLDRWLERPSGRRGLVFCVITALMLLAKPQMVFMAVPLAALAVARKGGPILINWRIILMALMSVVPALWYGWYAHHTLVGEAGISFAQPELLRHGLLLDPGFYQKVVPVAVSMALTLPVAALALAGVILSPLRGRSWWIEAWVAGGLLLFVLMPGAVSVNGYYHLSLVPPMVALAGRGLGTLFEGGRFWRRALVSLLTLAAAGWSAYVAVPMFRSWNVTERACGEWIRAHAAPEDRVLVASESPTTLYHTDRDGWTCWREGRGQAIRFNPELVERLLAQGLDWIALPSPHFLSRSEPDHTVLRSWLFDTYHAYTEEGFTVFHVGRQPDLSVGSDPVSFHEPESFRLLRGPWSLVEGGAALIPGGAGEVEVVPPEGTDRVRIDLSVGAPHLTLELTCNGILMDTWMVSVPGRPISREILLPIHAEGEPLRLSLQATPPGEGSPVLVLHRMSFLGATTP